jgi:hypothetical protein
MVTIQQGLRADGIVVSMAKLCRWFGVARRTVYYKPTKAPPKVKAELAGPIKALIEEEPSFGYRTVAELMGSGSLLDRPWRTRPGLLRALSFAVRIGSETALVDAMV